MVQQCGLEHGPTDPQAVQARHREVRVEQDPEVSVHRGHGEALSTVILKQPQFKYRVRQEKPDAQNINRKKNI